MKPASITIRLPSAGVFFILIIEIRYIVIAIFPYNIGFLKGIKKFQQMNKQILTSKEISNKHFLCR